MKTKWQQDLKRILGLRYEVTHSIGDILKCKHKDIIDPIFIMMVGEEDFVIYGINESITAVETNEIHKKSRMREIFDGCEVAYGK